MFRFLLCLFQKHGEQKSRVLPEIPGVENPMVSEGKDELAKESQCRCPAHLILLIIYGHQTILRHPFSLKYGPKKLEGTKDVSYIPFFRPPGSTKRSG